MPAFNLHRAGFAVLLFLAGPLSAQAGGIGFQSQLPIPVIVQGATVVDNTIRRGPAVMIAPGKLGWDLDLKPGFRFVTIYDGRQPNRVLFQGNLPFAGQDALFVIRTIPRNPFRVAVAPLTPP